MTYTNSDAHTTTYGTPLFSVGAYGTLIIGPDADLYSDLYSSTLNTAPIFVTGTNATINNAGRVTSSTSDAISGDSLAGSFSLYNSGQIFGDYGLHLKAGNAWIDNTGLIQADYAAISLDAGGNDIHNTGTIVGKLAAQGAIQIIGGGNQIENQGTIAGVSESAIFITQGDSTYNTIVNSGVISAPVQLFAIWLYSGNDQVINTGQIQGSMLMGYGNDYFDNSSGLITGSVDGSFDADTLIGGAGAESFNGGYGDDWISGGAGADSLDGSGGDDEIYGGAGDDTVIGGPGADVLDGGDGFDTLSYRFSGTGVLVNLTTGEAYFGDAEGDSFSFFERVSGSNNADTLLGSAARDTLSGGLGDDSLAGLASRDELNGGGGSDTLDGGDGQDLLRGGDDNDLLRGGNGNDTLRGDAAADTLVGGAGLDLLLGGGGNDVFRFTSTTDSPNSAARDIIADFVGGQDRIDLSALDADTTLAGVQHFTSLISAPTALNGAGVLKQSITTNGDTLVQGDVNGGGADFSILLRGSHTLTLGDFILS